MRIERTTATVLVLCVSAIATAMTAAGESLEYRYGKALNDGRDVSELTEALEQLAFPPVRSRSVESLRADAAAILDRIEASAAPASVTRDDEDGTVRSGNDWPSMGGGISHRGETSEPGPSPAGKRGGTPSVGLGKRRRVSKMVRFSRPVRLWSIRYRASTGSPDIGSGRPTVQ